MKWLACKNLLPHISGRRLIFNYMVFIQSYTEKSWSWFVFILACLTSGQCSFIRIFTSCMHQYNMAVEIPCWMKELHHPNITASISSTNNAENPIISMGKPSAKKYTSYSMKNTTLVIYLNCLFVYEGFVWFFPPQTLQHRLQQGWYQSKAIGLSNCWASLLGNHSLQQSHTVRTHLQQVR